MTNDPYVERLSALLDDELSADEQREVEAHVETCATCRGILTDLRTVVAKARALEPGEPPRDLWPAIAARIEAERDVVLPLADAPARGRRFSFTMPQLAAASIALIMVSGTSAWMLGRTAASPAVAVVPADAARSPSAVDATIGVPQDVAVAESNVVDPPTTAVAQRDIPSASQPVSPTSQPVSSPASRPVSTVAGVRGDDSTAMQVAQLERMLEDGETALSPATIAVLRRNLLIIDAALAEASAALETDPANPYLSRHYQNTMLKKLELLRQAGSIGRGVS